MVRRRIPLISKPLLLNRPPFELWLFKPWPVISVVPLINLPLHHCPTLDWDNKPVPIIKINSHRMFVPVIKTCNTCVCSGWMVFPYLPLKIAESRTNSVHRANNSSSANLLKNQISPPHYPLSFHRPRPISQMDPVLWPEIIVNTSLLWGFI